VERTITSTLELRSALNLIMDKATENPRRRGRVARAGGPGHGELIFEVTLADAVIFRDAPADGTGIVARWRKRRNPSSSTRRSLTSAVLRRGQVRRVQNECTDGGAIGDKDRVIGVLEVINKRDGTPFQRGRPDLLSAFAANAAISIENARLTR